MLLSIFVGAVIGLFVGLFILEMYDIIVEDRNRKKSLKETIEREAYCRQLERMESYFNGTFWD